MKEKSLLQLSTKHKFIIIDFLLILIVFIIALIIPVYVLFKKI